MGASKLISVHDLKDQMCGKFYGSKYKVFRQYHVEELLQIWSAIYYLSELHIRCRMVYNDEKFRKQCINSYNSSLLRIKTQYPTIKEIQQKKTIQS